MAVLFADTDDKINRVIAACYRARDRGEAVGLDTEFYNVEVGKQSCVARSKLHLLSIAVARHPVQLHPRGYRVADSAVLLAPSHRIRSVVSWLADSSCLKAIHNAPVDIHTLVNEGLEVRGGINTLDLARYAWPERARGPGFSLDALGSDFCGVGKLAKFEEIFSEEVTEYSVRTKKVRECECGEPGCRRRSTTPGHQRIERVEETRIPRQTTVDIPLETVVPGHKRWAAALEYSAQDAVLALAVYELAKKALEERQVIAPWL